MSAQSDKSPRLAGGQGSWDGVRLNNVELTVARVLGKVPFVDPKIHIDELP
jgi:hypothetical protein